MQILPDGLQKEQDRLAEYYFSHEVKEPTLVDYILAHGSVELVAFINDYRRQKAEALGKGIIIN